MNCYSPANHTITKILTEPKIEIAIGVDIINRMNRIYSNDDPSMRLYRANSQMFISNTLIRVISEHQDQIEIIKDSSLIE
jgi:hypothetical protein